MNDIISWLAANNTLMIRVGFSAVAVLVVAYVFRLFFMPRDVEKAADPESSTSSSAASLMNIEELAEMQTEIDTLKEKLKLAEIEKIGLPTPPLVQPGQIENAADSAPSGVVKAAQQSGDSVPAADNESMIKMSIEKTELLEKIQQLESRLVEYEIIAEDIAEVAQLKSENAELKAKIEKINLKTLDANAAEAVPVENLNPPEEIVIADTPVVEPHDTAASDAEIDAMLQESLTSPGTDNEVATTAPPPSHIIITSELEVSDEEQKIIDDFENFQSRKKG